MRATRISSQELNMSDLTLRQSIIDDISTAAQSLMPRLREVVSGANGASAGA